MQINNAINPVFSNRSNTNQILSMTKKQDTVGAEQVRANYDIHNMSPDEMRELAKELHESGQISDSDRIMFSMEIDIMTEFGGVPRDSKIDMVDHFNRSIKYEKSLPEPQSYRINKLERLVDILHGVEFKGNINFPISI